MITAMIMPYRIEVPTCDMLKCDWVCERDGMNTIWYHLAHGEWSYGLAFNREHGFVLPDEDCKPKKAQMIRGKMREFFASHHLDPARADFDEERERARLVAV